MVVEVSLQRELEAGTPSPGVIRPVMAVAPGPAGSAKLRHDPPDVQLTTGLNDLKHATMMAYRFALVVDGQAHRRALVVAGPGLSPYRTCSTGVFAHDLDAADFGTSRGTRCRRAMPAWIDGPRDRRVS
jgi:hypothetical protein